MHLKEIGFLKQIGALKDNRPRRKKAGKENDSP
jgi:hypothetical protein